MTRCNGPQRSIPVKSPYFRPHVLISLSILRHESMPATGERPRASDNSSRGLPNFFPSSRGHPSLRENALCNGVGRNRVARSETRPAIILGFNTQLSVTWHSRRRDGRRKEEGSPLLRKKGGGEGVKRNRQRGGWRVTTDWLPQDERCPLDRLVRNPIALYSRSALSRVLII